MGMFGISFGFKIQISKIGPEKFRGVAWEVFWGGLGFCWMWFGEWCENTSDLPFKLILTDFYELDVEFQGEAEKCRENAFMGF